MFGDFESLGFPNHRILQLLGLAWDFRVPGFWSVRAWLKISGLRGFGGVLRLMFEGFCVAFQA